MIPVVLMIGLAMIFGFNGLYGQDSHEYLRFATEWKAAGMNPGMITEFQWPVGFPLFGIVLSYLGVPLMWSMNIVSVLAAVGILVYTNKIIELLYGKSGRLWLILAGATQVYFIRGGILVMSDMLSGFFVILTYYQLFRYRNSNQWFLIFFAFLAATAAFFTRYASVPLLVPPLIYGFLIFYRNLNGIVKFISLLVMFTLITVLLWSNNRLLTLSAELFDQWSIENIFKISVKNADGIYFKTVPNVLYIFGNFFHIGYLSIGVLLIPFYKYCKPAFQERTILIGLTLYFLTIIGLQTQNYRFLILSHSLVLILLFGAFNRLHELLSIRKFSSLFIAGVLLFNTAFFYYSFRKTYAVHHAEKQVTDALKKLNHKGIIYAFFVDQSFPSYGVNNEVKNLYLETYTNFESGALVVYNSAKFEEQWQGTRVESNWKYLKDNFELDTVVSLNDNWRIYEIK